MRSKGTDSDVVKWLLEQTSCVFRVYGCGGNNRVEKLWRLQRQYLLSSQHEKQMSFEQHILKLR